MRNTEIDNPKEQHGVPLGDTLPAHCVLPLLQALPTLGNTTTVILHGGCVFEFKGVFPRGTVAEDFYNLESEAPGLHGHLRLKTLRQVRFQDRPHRGRASFAFVFEDAMGHCLFKVFLGRDARGTIIPAQLVFFEQLRRERRVPPAQPATLTPASTTHTISEIHP